MKKNIIWNFLFQKNGNFWSILLGHFIKHKPLISEESYRNIRLLFSDQTLFDFNNRPFEYICIFRFKTNFFPPIYCHNMGFQIALKHENTPLLYCVVVYFFTHKKWNYSLSQFKKRQNVPHTWTSMPFCNFLTPSWKYEKKRKLEYGIHTMVLYICRHLTSFM